MSYLIGVLLTLVSLAVTTCRALPDFHKQMSPQQLQRIFHVDTPDAVPHYEVVQLLHHDNQQSPTHQHHNHYRRRKRSIDSTKQRASTNSVYGAEKDLNYIKDHKVSFNVFGKNMNLTLKHSQGIFQNGQVHHVPMWYVDEKVNATHGLHLQKIEDEFNHTSDNVGQVFQDEENMAAILMRRQKETGDLVMEGTIGHELVIKPLPQHLAPDESKSHHVIYKRSINTSEFVSDFALMDPDDFASSDNLEELHLEEAVEQSTNKRTKRQAPFIIYPEILVIVDYDSYRLHGGDNVQVKRYFVSFWNGVDLRYRVLKGPKIRISIAGIIISRGRDATPYLERNRVGRDAIDSAAALTDMGKYLFRERRLPVYDIAVVVTKYDMCRRRKGGRCTKGTAGFAYVGGACVVNKHLEKVNSVAIIEDTGGFSGIIVAAHEVGHLLGAVHDGSPPPSYLGGPGAQRCRWEDGYIMSDLRHTERGFRWSPCAVQSFQHFLNGDTATCMHNAPHEDSALGRSLPGTLLSLDAQCRRDRGTYACFKDERVCAQLFCFDSQTGYCVAYRPAAEGSSCGNNLHCLDGRCTPLLSNYNHQYRVAYNNSLHNAAGADNIQQALKQEESADENDKDDGHDDDDEGNGGEDNDESNETIGKLKRKLSLSLTTKPLQLQPQLKQQLPTTGLPPSHAYLATSSPRYGSKSTTTPKGRSSLVTATYFENYFKKLQHLNTNSNRQQKPTISSSEIFKINENRSKLKLSKSIENRQNTEEQQENIEDGNKTVNNFEAQFLRRTPENPSTNEDYNDNDNYSSSSLNTNNPYFITKTTISTTPNKAYRSSINNNNNNSYRNNKQNNKLNNNHNDNHEPIQTILVTPSAATRPQTPIYVTNFIDDNTPQRLTTIRQHQQLKQQDTTATTMTLQQYNSQQLQLSTTQQQQPPPSNSQQFESLHLLSSTTTRRPKIKTQKLIRRLRTQNQ